jgi:hypothetical protein
MRTGIELILTRAKATRHAQESIKAGWVWEEKTPEQWDGDIDSLEKLQEVLSTAEIDRNTTRAALDTALLDMHRRTMQGLAMAKVKCRNDPVKLDLLSHLTSRGDSRAVTAQEAMDWELAWQKIDPAWCPTANNTLAAFQALRKQCLDLEAAFMAAHTNWRNQSEMMNRQAALLHEANISWYAAATRAFAAGTAEGDTIRRSIPTIHTPTPAPAPVPPPAKIATQSA